MATEQDRRIIISQLTQLGIVNEVREIAEKLVPGWDFEDLNDLGRFLIDLGSAIAERNNVYANILANECFIQTAKDPFHIALLAAYQRYRIRTAQPTKVLMDITLNNSHVAPITIPAFELQVSNKESSPVKKFFENEEDIVFPAFSTEQLAQPFIEGQSKTADFVSDGLDFQSYNLPDVDIIIDEVPGVNEDFGIDVDTTSELGWKLVDSFAFSVASDFPFMVTPALDGTMFVSFSDDTLGAKPAQGEDITVKYRVGGGDEIVLATEVNEVANLITTLPIGIEIETVENSDPTFSGKVREDKDLTKRAVPLIGSREIVLLREDHIELVAAEIAGVARVKIVPVTTTLFATVIPNGGGQPTPALLDEVEQIILVRLGIGYDIQAFAPVYTEVDRSYKVYTTDDFTKLEVDIAVRNKINERLNSLAVDEDGVFVNAFGTGITLAEQGFLLKKIPQLFDYEVILPTVDLLLNPQQVLTQVNTPGSLIVSGHTSGVDLLFKAATPKSFANISRIQIIAAAGTDITSVLTDNSPTGLDYVLTLGTNLGQSSITAIRDFVNSDPNLVIPNGTILNMGELVVGDTRLLVCESADDSNDDLAFSAPLTVLDTSSATNFDVEIVGGT